MSILTLLTLVAVAIVVLVLVVYLVGIAYYLWRADRHLEGVGRILERK